MPGPDNATPTIAAGDVTRLRELLDDHAGAVALVTTRTGKFLWGSRAGSENLFGRLPVEYEGQYIWPFIHPHDKSTVGSQLRQAIEGLTVRFDCRARTDEGHWQQMTCAAWASTLDTGNAVIVYMCVPRDDPPSAERRSRWWQRG